MRSSLRRSPGQMSADPSPRTTTLTCSMMRSTIGSGTVTSSAPVDWASTWIAKKHNVGGLTEGFRGWDGIQTIVEAIKAAGKADAEAITKALWTVKVKGINGDIAFIKQGPDGKESAQNVPSVYLVKIEGGKVVRQ